MANTSNEIDESKTHEICKINDVRRDINAYETLCLYCANNDIDLAKIDDHDFDSVGVILNDAIRARRVENLNCERALYFAIDKK